MHPKAVTKWHPMTKVTDPYDRPTRKNTQQDSCMIVQTMYEQPYMVFNPPSWCTHQDMAVHLIEHKLRGTLIRPQG